MYINHENVIEEYEKLKQLVVKRKEQFDKFVDMLENKTNWLTTPASTKYHLDCDKGLLIHSVGVASTLLEIKKCLLPYISDESCVIVGLLHDVGKIGMPGKSLYLKGEKGYFYNPNVVSMGLAVRSLYLVSQYISLSDDEAQAIAYHDGQYIEENKIVAHKEAPITLLVHYADYWTAHMFEDEKMRKRMIKGNYWSVLEDAKKQYPENFTQEAENALENRKVAELT